MPYLSLQKNNFVDIYLADFIYILYYQLQRIKLHQNYKALLNRKTLSIKMF